jgi:hypothetical protein
MKRSLGLFALLIGFGVFAAPAAATDYDAVLSGLNVNPPNASPATGFTDVTVTGNTLTVNVNWSGLITPASAAHIHCCGVPPTNLNVAVGFPSFPGAASGSYLHVFDMTDSTIYTSGFLAASGGTTAGAEAALIAALNNNGNQTNPPTLVGTYVNVHTSTFPGGEIRGFPSVPEPSTMALMAIGVAGVGFVARRRRG